MVMETDTREYTSPQRKLLRFFQKSRDGWKRKYRDLKQTCKLLGNQVRAVERSRQHWRELAQDRGRRLRALERELAELKNVAAELPAAGPGGAAGAAPGPPV